LVHYLIAPMIVGEPARANHVFAWAKSKNRWLRRATCVALIQGTRRKMFFPEIKRLSGQAPRLVLRTACEKLKPGVRKKILAKPS
jgi:DNA alkylation repair enzyme